MNGEIQITDLVISKLLRQNIEKYRSLFPHVAAAIKLNVSGIITNRGDNVDYIYTDSNHLDPLQRIVPARLLSSESYDKEKYLEMMLDSAEAVLSVFGFSRSLDLVDLPIRSVLIIGRTRFINNVSETLKQRVQNYKMIVSIPPEGFGKT